MCQISYLINIFLFHPNIGLNRVLLEQTNKGFIRLNFVENIYLRTCEYTTHNGAQNGGKVHYYKHFVGTDRNFKRIKLQNLPNS